MKESLPNQNNENINFHSLARERVMLKGTLKGTPDDFKPHIEKAVEDLNEQAKNFSIENMGGLSKAKERLKTDKNNMVVDQKLIEREMGDEYKKISELSDKLKETESFEQILLSKQKQNPNAKTIPTIISTLVKEKTALQKQIAEIEMERPDVVRAFEIVSYKKDLSEEGHIAHTPSVENSQAKIVRRMVVGKSMFLHGPTGTGKTSQARLASKQMTGSDPEMVYCNPQTREGNIWSKTGIRPSKEGGGAIETVSILGPLAQAMEEGRIIIFDEFTALPQEQMVMIKGVFNAKVGDSVNIVGNGKTTIKSGFQMIFTANLKSDKNPEKQPLPPEIAREFAQNNLEIKYTPQDESWDIMVTRLLNPDGSLDMSQYDLTTTLPKLAEAMADIQTAYTGELSDEMSKETQTQDAGGKKPSLKKLVLTQGDIESIMDDWNIEKQIQGNVVQKTSFIEFLDRCLKTGLTFKEYPEKDRALATKILASKGFLTTLSPQDLDLPSDIFTFTGAEVQRDKSQEKISKSQKVEHIALKDLANIDPYNRRGQKMKDMANDFLTDEEKNELNANATSAEPIPESTETINTNLTDFLLETYKGWNVSQDKVDVIKWSTQTLNPKTENYETKKTDIDASKYGQYTLNPDTKDIDWDTIPQNKIKMVELPASMNNKNLSGIGEYLKTAYPNAKLPGLEYYKYILENPAKAPSTLKDGNYHFFFGSLFRYSDGHWDVPCVGSDASGLGRGGLWLDYSWRSDYRVVLLEN